MRDKLQIHALGTDKKVYLGTDDLDAKNEYL
jgi:hypothetical protein